MPSQFQKETLLFIAQTYNGFLPTRGSFMLDFVFLAMFVIVLVLAASIYLVKYKRQFRLHKRIQIATAIVLLLTVVAFEVDVRFFTVWRELAEPSAWYASGVVDRALAIHLAFAIPTPLIWAYTIVMAVRKISLDDGPTGHDSSHRFWGRLSAGMMMGTAITGWVFYLLAFVF